MAGCGGMLGEAFYRQFKNDFVLKCTDKDVNEDWLTYLDFRDFEAYQKEVLAFKPDYLFHLGAITDLEECERDPDNAYLTNTIAVENATHLANQLGVPLLYISTAGIFDGIKDIYDDWDVANPLGHYARSKYLGEVFVKENAKKFFVCRAGWMMGAGPEKDKKFIHKLMRQIQAGKKELHIVNDKDGTPTYTQDFAKTVKEIIKTEFWGVYNLVCNELTSRAEVTAELLKILNLQDVIKIVPVSSDYFSKEYFAPRPPSERLINYKLNLRKLNYMRDWKVALNEYIKEYYADFR